MSEIKILIPRYNDEENFKIFAEPSIKKLGIRTVFQIFDEAGKRETIFKKYNAGLEALVGIENDDIVVFMHSDVGIVDPVFKEKLEMAFNDFKDVGMVGVIGTTELQEQGGWWANSPSVLKGHCLQGKNEPNSKKGEGYHLVKGDCGMCNLLVAVDGLFFAIRGSIIKEGLTFDTETFPDGNDFYDCDTSMQILEKGWKIAVVDILLYHQSSGLGSLESSWKINHDRFITKWKNKGYKFPILSSDFKKKEIFNNIIEIEI